MKKPSSKKVKAEFFSLFSFETLKEGGMKWRLRLCVSIEVRQESWSPIMPFTVRKKKRLPLLGGLEQGAHVASNFGGNQHGNNQEKKPKSFLTRLNG